MERGDTLREYGGGFLLLCLILVLWFGYVILKPFITIFMVALVLATISQPVYSWVLRRTRGRRTISALLTTMLVVLLLIVPCLVLIGILAQQSIQAYNWVNDRVQAGILDQNVVEQLLDLQRRLLPQLEFSPKDAGKTLTELAGRASSLLVGWSAAAVKAVTAAVWQFFLMLFALFYFLRDGGMFLRWVMHLTPLPGSLQRELFERFRGVSESAFYGAFVISLTQGFLGAIGFLIVGLQPLVWGVAMAFFSLIPAVGTALVWGPAAALLILTHRVSSGIFLIAWGILVVSMSDNVLRPIIMKGRSELHPLLVFFSLLGGVFAFGPLGILLGPLAMVLAVSLLQAYEKAAHPLLDELSRR